MKTPILSQIFLLCLFCFCSHNNLLSETVTKKAFVITGPESSGSRFIARVIAHVTGKDKRYLDWNGIKMNGKLGDDLIILHLSQPHNRPTKFSSLRDFKNLLKGYELKFIITTRDQNIVKKSKIKSYFETAKSAKEHQILSRKILTEIIKHESCFIWSYETQQYLREIYFQKLYEFLGVNTNFFPRDLFDANQKYLKTK